MESHDDGRPQGSRSDARGEGHALRVDLAKWLPELIWTCEVDGLCDFVSERWPEYTGMPLAAHYGTGWMQAVHPEDGAAFRSTLERAARGRHDFRTELRLRRRDGAYRRFAARVTAVRDAEGRLSKWLGQLSDVQEQHELRERLRDKTEQLEKLVAAIPGLICTYEQRPDGPARFPYASPAIRDVYGIEPEQAAEDAAAVFDRIHPDDGAALAQQIEASARALTSWRGKFRYAHPTKGERYIEGFSAPVVQPDGRMTWHGVVFDVTQQHHEQQALRAALQRSAARDRIGRALSQATSFEAGLGELIETVCRVEDWQLGAIWMQASADEPPRCVARWHEPSLAEPLAGFLARTEPGRAPSPEDAADIAALLSRPEPFEVAQGRSLAEHPRGRARHARACGLASVLYGAMRHGDNLRALVELGGTRTRHGVDGSLELIFALGTQVYLCAERLNAERALRESEQRLQSVIANMSEGLVVADPSLKLMHWNPAALELHGFEREEDWNRHLSEFQNIFELSTLDGRVLAFDEWPMPRIMRGEALRAMEVRIRRLDRPWERVFGYGGCLVRQPDGRALSFLTITDLTERTRATEALQRLNAELEERVAKRTAELLHINRELESFSYSVSHDLRAPLRAMNGYAQVLIEDFGKELPAEAQRMLGVIAKSGRHMGELIDDLLALSRLGRTELHTTRFAMRALVDQVLAEGDFPGQEQAQLAIDELGECTGDARMLKQVWVNLLSNAFKYARGKSPVVVEVRAERTETETIYSVHDNGAGFDMRYVHKLFGVFQRLHTEEEFEGTGVGLAIVQRIVNRHGGRVWATSELGRGATFSFSLPRSQGT